MSLGMGVFITYGSYLKDHDEIPISTAWIVGLDTLFALMAGFAIFPAVFALGFQPASGPGLIFITLPAVFAQMPLGIFFGVLFFILVAIAALTSSISLLEVVTAWLIDEKGWTRKKASVLMGLVIFIVGIPAALGYNLLSGVSFPGLKTDILDTYDWFANSVLLPVGGLLLAIFTGYVWGTQKAIDEANKGKTNLTIGKLWSFLIRYIVPLLIVGVMVMGIYDSFGKK